MANPVRVEMYSRPGCHLCDEAKAVIDRVRRKYGFELSVVNVESDPALEASYGTEIPVVVINGNKAFKYRVGEADFERKVKRLWNQ